MRLVRPADEAYCSRTHAERVRCTLLRPRQLRIEREAEVRVGIHPDEFAIALTVEQQPRSAAALGGTDGDHHRLRAFPRSGIVEIAQLRFQITSEPSKRHVSPLSKMAEHVLGHGGEPGAR